MRPACNDNLTSGQRRRLVELLAGLDQGGYTEIRFRRGLSAWAAVRRSGFMWAIATGSTARPDAEHLWCYPTFEQASVALADWAEAPEPMGWTRHFPSGRHRPGGDPAEEQVEDGR